MLLYIFKILHGDDLNILKKEISFNKTSTRNSHNLFVPRICYKKSEIAFYYLAPKLWNELDKEQRTTSNFYHFKMTLALTMD
jgi:hypothetical protein